MSSNADPILYGDLIIGGKNPLETAGRVTASEGSRLSDITIHP